MDSTEVGAWAELPLSDGGVAIVDADDLAWLSRWTWRRGRQGYVIRSSAGRHFSLHRQIVKPGAGLQVDHIDGDKLNNRRSNLRPCTNRQNAFNQRSRRGTSRFKGVVYHKQTRKWQASIVVNYHKLYLGLHDNETDAARAYDRAAREHFGDFAAVNLDG